MKAARSSPKWICFAILLGSAAWSGCRPERYFGPYRLELPSQLQERSAARTFRLPLNAEDQREQDNLDWCLANQPDREVPCECDLPVLTVDEQQLRLDYRLVHSGGAAANVSVWVGLEAPAGQPAPALLPDLPRVEVMAIHLHRLLPGQAIDDSFSEEELRQADLAYAAARFELCDLEPGELPAPRHWLVGTSLPGEELAKVVFDFTMRVRP
jgi:hypothetical protein